MIQTLKQVSRRYYTLRLFIILNTLFLIACGGSAGQPVPDIPIVIEPSEPPISEVCDNQINAITFAEDDGTFHDNYSPNNAIDGNTSAASRWSSNGINKALIIDLGESKMVRAVTIKWFEGAKRIASFEVEASTDKATWNTVLQHGESSGKHSGFELVNVDESTARYVKIVGLGNSKNDNNSIVELQVHSCEGASGEFTGVYPNEVGIELLDWYLSVPSDDDNNGRSDSISESELANGYTNSEYFYASSDNGIVMRSPSYGFKTSQNTKYVRVELREMLRRGDRSISTQGVNKNNWVFGSASAQNQTTAGGVDGDLHVTLAVNNVTTSGENFQIGRVIIGQIHANDDEPVRLYYRKLPGNSRGSIYFAHESRVEDGDGDNIETYIEMIGSRSNSASNPEDGIALDEKFSYHIKVNVNLLSVTISREGKDDVVAHYDMSESLYDEDGQYHYFKVGVYHVNNSSDPEEYAQATFYRIKNSHTGYAASE